MGLGGEKISRSIFVVTKKEVAAAWGKALGR
jgi:hypothetical protein